MATTKQKSVKIRETKSVVFQVLKNAAPTAFGTKVFADVAFFSEDPDDTSKIMIEFNEEVET